MKIKIKNKVKILVLISIVLVVLFMLQAGAFQQREYLPGFDLEIPSSNQARVQRTNNFEDNIGKLQDFRSPISEKEELRIIVQLKDPSEIKEWSSQVTSMNRKELSGVKNAMKDYSIEKIGQEKVGHRYSSFEGFSAKLTQEDYQKLLENPLIKLIQEDQPVQTLLNESADIVNASYVWDYKVGDLNLTGVGQTICVLDTGIDYNHHDFGGSWGEKVIGGYRFLDNGEDWQNCETNNLACFDGDGHGTHVAGIVAASGAGGLVKGIAPEANLFVIKVLNDSGSGWSSDIIAGIDYCRDNAEDYGISVISMSLGSPCYYKGAWTDKCSDNFCDSSNPLYSLAINNTVSEGISVVVATGNDGGSSYISSPACIEKAIRVGSTIKADINLSTFSNRWGLDMIVAPGSDILSTYPPEWYAWSSGTSMSTPHVAGAIAILNQYLAAKGVSKTPPELNTILKDTGKEISEGGRTYKRIDVYQALLELDIYPPEITINSPTDTTYTNASILINLTVEDDLAIDSILYNWDGTNSSYDIPQLIEFINGTHVLHVWANDSAGNLGYKNVSFVVDLPPECVENITFTEWSEWVDLTCINDTHRNQSRYQTEYDSNDCGTFENVTHYEYQVVEDESCYECVENITFTEWSEWVDLTCINDTHRNQSRYQTEYDSNDCGTFENVTHYEYQVVEDESCYECVENITFTEWSEWVDLTCINDTHRNQSRYQTEYDSNDCGTFENVTHYEYQAVEDGSCYEAPEEKIIGNISDIVTNLDNINIKVNGSTNLSDVAEGVFNVTINEGNFTRLEFKFNFSENILNLSAINITKQQNSSDFGAILIQGINLTENQTKTVYMDKIGSNNGVCILDEEFALISQISDSCTENNEISLVCDGQINNQDYYCVLDGTTYKIGGLRHSALREYTYTAPQERRPGGGSSSGGIIFAQTCQENWTCSEWSECMPEGKKTRTCEDLNNCTTENNKPSTEENCIYKEKEVEEAKKETIVHNKSEEDSFRIPKTGFAANFPELISPIYLVFLLIILILVGLFFYKKENILAYFETKKNNQNIKTSGLKPNFVETKSANKKIKKNTESLVLDKQKKENSERKLALSPIKKQKKAELNLDSLFNKIDKETSEFSEELNKIKKSMKK